MGKYMKKSSNPSSSFGVRTRARSLSLQTSPKIPDASSYLQLRSRRLPKLQPPNPSLADCSAKTASSQVSAEKMGASCGEEENGDVGMEGSSFGDNFLEGEARDRSTRESTPCSLIRDSDAIHTPGSTTRQRTHQIIHEHMQRNIPTAYEMEEFFSYAEKQQQTVFMDKYNFDIVNDVPLSGRYEWVPVLH